MQFEIVCGFWLDYNIFEIIAITIYFNNQICVRVTGNV